MRWHRFACVASATSVLVVPGALARGGQAPPSGPGASGRYLLTKTHPGKGYAPTFTGNGQLGVRVP